jgi:organic radical activating enzyme
VHEVVSWLKGHVIRGVDLLVITGGEPLLQQAGLCELIRISCSEFPDLEFEIETNGTIRPRTLTELPSASRVSFNVSPKLSNSGNPRDQRINLEALRDFTRTRAIYKFVVSSPGDLDEIDDLISQVGIPRRRVYLMPEGTDSETVSRHLTALADLAIERGYNLTTRLHIILWGKERLR